MMELNNGPNKGHKSGKRLLIKRKALLFAKKHKFGRKITAYFLGQSTEKRIFALSKQQIFLSLSGKPLSINLSIMYWTLELASKLEDAPWPATKEELIDYAMRSGSPMEVVENLQELEDEGEIYETIEDVWPDYPTKEDFLFNEDEY